MDHEAVHECGVPVENVPGELGGVLGLAQSLGGDLVPKEAVEVVVRLRPGLEPLWAPVVGLDQKRLAGGNPGADTSPSRILSQTHQLRPGAEDHLPMLQSNLSMQGLEIGAVRADLPLDPGLQGMGLHVAHRTGRVKLVDLAVLPQAAGVILNNRRMPVPRLVPRALQPVLGDARGVLLGVQLLQPGHNTVPAIGALKLVAQH
mmetsp:Transcript_126950/g.290462  ORF Transcript_126950/g.290462 Transcript_126950/m.290462 type:complete len:203 (-) Transcript_126950:763-1371(-)